MPSHLRCYQLALVGMTALTSVMGTTAAHANDRQACLEAYDNAQTMKQEGKLVAARERLLVCARNVCPTILRKDCTQWLSEVDASIPTVVISVQDASGRDLVDVKVTVNDQPFLTQIDGKAVRVDPGVHTFRFEVDGQEPVEERVVIHAAAKNRPISIKIGKLPGRSSGDKDALTSGGGADTTAKSAPTTAYIFGGVGLVGLGAFAYFGSQFQNKLDDMDSCKPNCPQSDADDASSKRKMAYLSAGIGVVGLGVATYLFFSSSTEPDAAQQVSRLPRVDLLPVRGGAIGSLGGRF